MGKDTNIGWTNHTFNPWWGCTKVSPGCDHCYAEAFDKRVGGEHWGKGVPRREMSANHWREPVHWNKAAFDAGRQAFVFAGSMCDVMDDEAPAGAREHLWELIDRTPYLMWLLLTKRPHRYARSLPSSFTHKNLILGSTTESQEFYDVRWPILRDVAADYGLQTFISYEPAIDALSMEAFAVEHAAPARGTDFPTWIIVGGETGSSEAERRPFRREWADTIKAESERNGVKFFMKQFSAQTPDQAAKLIPADLLIRQYPERQP